MRTKNIKNNNYEVLCVIGARSGSQGVKNKNIREFNGKPLMAWIINAATSAKLVSRVIVSTDSDQYAKVAMEHGAEVPFLRPQELATNLSPEFDYVEHLIEELAKTENYIPDIVVRLLPTVPLQSSNDIDRCIKKISDTEWASSAVAVSEARQHPIKALKLLDGSNGKIELKPYTEGSSREITPIARQNYSKAYFRANIIACWTPVIKSTKSLTGDHVAHVEVENWKAFDIDSETDFLICELIAKNRSLFETK
jgi:CMP-N,N'-diacetyllegionaminic acid synthase